MAQYISQVSYGLTSPLQVQSPFPVQAHRAPTAADVGYIPGQVWVYLDTNIPYILTSITNNQANWQNLLGGSASFTTLTSTGQFNLDTTTVGANTLGNTTGATSVTVSSGTGGIALAAANGPVLITSGTGTIGIGTDFNAKTITIGNDTGTTSVFVAVGTGNSASFGSNATDHGTFVGSLAGASQTTIRSGTTGILLNAPFVVLPGPVYIYSGSGTPSNGLALHTGDFYLNSTAASAATRLFVATGPGAWTNVTCAA